MGMIPIVIEQPGRGERAYDIYSRLLRDNIIFIGTPIDDDVANVVIAQMLFLAQEDSEKDVQLYINSPGGSITAGMAIYDTMQYLPNDIMTLRRTGSINGSHAVSRWQAGEALRPPELAHPDPSTHHVWTVGTGDGH